MSAREFPGETENTVPADGATEDAERQVLHEDGVRHREVVADETAAEADEQPTRWTMVRDFVRVSRSSAVLLVVFLLLLLTYLWVREDPFVSVTRDEGEPAETTEVEDPDRTPVDEDPTGTAPVETTPPGTTPGGTTTPGQAPTPQSPSPGRSPGQGEAPAGESPAGESPGQASPPVGEEEAPAATGDGPLAAPGGAAAGIVIHF